MRMRLLVLLLPWLSIGSVYAQYDLTGARQTSMFTYIYRVDASEALALFRSGLKDPVSCLHTKVDSFITGKMAEKVLPGGNYLYIWAAGSRICVELRTIGALRYEVINNNHDWTLSLHSRDGVAVTGAEVWAGKVLTGYDSTAHGYVVRHMRDGGHVQVRYQGSCYYFPVAAANRYHVQRRSWWKWLYAGSNGGGYRRYRNYFREGTEYEKKFRSYMVFSKPVYKPGDTVRGKAFVLGRRGRPVGRILRLRISDYSLKRDTVIRHLHPYRDGGYDFSFVADDSLRLGLDETYTITLEEDKSRLYDPADYNGDLDGQEYAGKRKVVARGVFRYEDYDLPSVRWTVRTDKEENSPGVPLSVYVKAVDENELPVPDARVELDIVYGETVTQFHAPSVFIPDTLWRWTQVLDPAGETKIVLPDSIFPAASFQYEIRCRMLNSSNEYTTEKLDGSYWDDTALIIFHAVGDSLAAEWSVRGKSRPVDARLAVTGAGGDPIVLRSFHLPGKIRMDPYANRYAIEGPDGVRGEFRTAVKKDLLSCVANRTQDSVFIDAFNPYGLNFWYTVFAGKRIVDRGYGRRLSYAARSATPRNYFVSLQYVWSGAVHKEDYTVPYRDKILKVDVKQPSWVYPGQEATIRISVKDAAGKPVTGADLTAYAYTAKFGSALSGRGMPYVGKWYPGQRRLPDLRAGKPDTISRVLALNWTRWSKEMGLDTLEYYRFLHPSPVYINREPDRAGLTQIAPFITIKGELIPIHLLYIDEEPVYFSAAQQMSRYSFPVSPGKHSIRMRTPDRMIRLDSMLVRAGMKTILCIDGATADSVAAHIHVKQMPPLLTTYERMLWSRYMIPVENNFRENFASIRQGDRVYLLNRHAVERERYNGQVLAGPLTGAPATLDVKERFDQDFQPEGGFVFQIESGLVREKQLPLGRPDRRGRPAEPTLFSAILSRETSAPDLRDRVLTEKEVDSLWEDYLDERSATRELVRNKSLDQKGSGRLLIGLEEFGGKGADRAGDTDEPGETRETAESTLFVKQLFLFRYDDTDFLRVYRGKERSLGFVQPGYYRLLILLKGDDYLLRDSLYVGASGLNYYAIGSDARHRRDGVSLRISDIVKKIEQGWKPSTVGAEMDVVRESFNEQYLHAGSFSRVVTGKVTNDRGMPLGGVTVRIKGTQQATSTNPDGVFSLHTPEKATLTFSYIGYNGRELTIGEEDNYPVRLEPMSSALNEVVVVGYGVSTRRMSTGSVSIISGSMLLEGTPPPLIIVDGLPYWGGLASLDSMGIASMRVLKGNEATAIYGTNAAGGVIIVTTQKATAAGTGTESGLPAAGNVLRHHFRDEAYWQPRLLTDRQGLASFSVRYPDDITNWKTFVQVVTDRQQTGSAEGSVRAFKMQAAQVACPAWLVSGDSVNVIGKMMNYSPDTIAVQETFSVNGRAVMDKEVELHNAWIDRFSVVAGKAAPGGDDSLRLRFTLRKKDGYFDGEERMIPVRRPGVAENKGIFLVLRGDTSLRLRMDSAGGPVTVYAESAALPVVLDEIDHIRDYEYLCNEQMASKLKVLLAKKKVYHFLGREFREDKLIRDLIGRLQAARNGNGLWGWWRENEVSPWISLHATEALLQAEEAGFMTAINKRAVTDWLIYNLERYRGMDELLSIRLLQELGAKADYRRYIDSASNRSDKGRSYERLRLMELKQAAGIDIGAGLDSLVGRHRETVFGNWFWGEENETLFGNEVQQTVLVYRLLKKGGRYADVLEKVREFFMERRAPGHWRNTYESCLILEEILPDLLAGGGEGRPGGSGGVKVQQADSVRTGAMARGGPGNVTLTILRNGPGVDSAGAGGVVTKWPYRVVLPPNGGFQINKKGSYPLYFTAYQQDWNTNPTAIAETFTVQTRFEKNGIVVSRLQAGKAVDMQVTVEAKADAEYVMVEIPIPSVCTYINKEQVYGNEEVHREYFSHKVSIFCKGLTRGRHLFHLSLMPRFTGRCQLNPARVEMMYFPLFFGREGMKTIDVF